ncbi:MAG: malto-oligosyltrehalose synthase [Deltaproteobacteria bacterium]|nr:malto-oligosyltrehalose synthase [Deltaproteobacteria bacterium]NIS77222.1 malto-oligosyltrehalose synthase [Deltaproteobacteria bacterium]
MHVPAATYRIQFSPSFTFGDARRIVPYLGSLGISHLYASPIFRAGKGSTHGYDVVDQNRVNPELGDPGDFAELVGWVKRNGLSWLQDFIPNHMAFHGENPMLADLLEKGKRSRYADCFDVVWDHPYQSIRGRILAPFLGRFYSECLEDGEILLAFGESGLSIRYHDHAFPLRIESYAHVFSRNPHPPGENPDGDDGAWSEYLELAELMRSVAADPGKEVVDEEAVSIKEGLWSLYSRSGRIREHIDGLLRAYAGEKGKPESFTPLDRLLSEQHFRLSFWKVATEEINYRRFFNINDLISVRVEDEKVFHRTHALMFKLTGEGTVSGLRIDHIDGLYDPAAYLQKVRGHIGDAYLVVEKILEPGESLPPSWPVEGTTGYDYLNAVNGLFCRVESGPEFSRIYSRFAGVRAPYDELLYEKKKLILERHMAGDVDNLAHLLKSVSGRYRYGSDITLYGLKRAILEVMAFFPVYRTYLHSGTLSGEDRKRVQLAVKNAIARNSAYLNELKLIERFLLLEGADHLQAEEREEWIHFIMRFQQFTGPLMAKGFEDTLLYVYNRLLSLNEVGGAPDTFGTRRDDFHRFLEKRMAFWPHSMNATSTHDTKRGEDVRSRINVLSEIPREWEGAVKKWARLNRWKKKRAGDIRVPDKNDEYFLYQTVVGALPSEEEEYPRFVMRLKEYLIKAVREAKIHTAWLKPDLEYEENFLAFVDAVLAPSDKSRFMERMAEFQKKVAYCGMFNSLSQTLIKITSPGVPDFYQGSELWELHLVDPDNRRPVDFEKRIGYLAEIRSRERDDLSGLIEELTHSMEDGRIKLFLIYRALRARRENEALFRDGGYTRLDTAGDFEDHLVAFARSAGDSFSVTVAPRFLTALTGENSLPHGREVWGDTSFLLPDGFPRTFEDAITGRIIEGGTAPYVGDVLSHFPAALLISRGGQA